MGTIFLETNALCRFLDEGVSGEEVRAILSAYGYQPVIGLHVIYELARTYLAGGKELVAKSLFEIVRDLDPDISEEPRVLLIRECEKFLYGRNVDGFLSGARKAETRQEIMKFSEGVFDDEARNFITSRDEQFKQDHPEIGVENINAFVNDPPKQNLRSFEDVVEYYKGGIPELVTQILAGNISAQQAARVANNLNDFPILRSIVMANIYLFFVAITHKNVPAKDKVDDHRHVIEASYCDAFLTEESQLLSNVRKINPDLEPIQWSTIGKVVSLEKSNE